MECGPRWWAHGERPVKFPPTRTILGWKFSFPVAKRRGWLGDRHSFGLRETSHYLAPVAGWNLPSGWTLRVSTGFGLNDNSHKFLLRWGLSREIKGFDQLVRRMFGAKS